MKKPNFFAWYYNQGTCELLEIWKNFLLFVWRHFSVRELLLTLFYPWKRDVSVSQWRGFHPLKALELLFGNLIARVLGAIIRLAVILFAIAVFLLILIFGLVINFLWISAPLAALALVIGATKGSINPYLADGSILGWLVCSVSGYLNDTKTPLELMEPEEFSKRGVFKRICGRLGLTDKNFPKEIFSSQELMDDFLKNQGLIRENYLSIVRWELQKEQKRIDSEKFWRWENLKKIIPIGRQWRYAYTVNLDKYCQDLSAGDPTDYGSSEMVGRADEYQILKLVLQRPDQNCVLVVGNSGIGKKTMIHFLARAVRLGEENDFADFRIMLVDLGRVISDAINRGEDVENFLRQIFYEAGYAGNIILVIEHLEQFLGKEASMYHPDISAVLSEFLQIPSFQIIATSTVKEYHGLIEKKDQVMKYFEVIEMREPSEEEAMEILFSWLDKYEKKRPLFTFKALEEIITGSAKYSWEFPLPERALDLAMDVLMFWEKNPGEQFVGEKTVFDYLKLKTGMEQGEVTGAESKKLLNLEEILHRQIIGQEEAIRQVSEAFRRSRSGIRNSKKPVGSFLFLGPTGVGKTETAKALAKTYFGDEKRMIRFDMSEFQTPGSLDRLLGSEQLNRPGRLITEVKDNPYSLILLDEIEKAYPEILDIFLQILDEGFVTDAFGEKINFASTMIIATSNAGSALIKKMVEENAPAEEIKQAVINYAIENNIFRSEFLNRFDGVIFFRPLREKELESVIRLQLKKFARRAQKEKNIEITFGDGVVKDILQKGYNPIFGARSLNRYIEDVIEGIVAKKIISGEVGKGEKINIEL